MVSLKNSFLTAVFLFTFQAQAQMAQMFPSQVTLELSCRNLKDIQKAFLFQHILYSEMTPTLEARVVDQYIKELDPTKIYFTQKDVEYVRGQLKELSSLVVKRDCTPLFKVQEFYVKKIKERVDYAKTRLAKNFVFNPKTKLTLDSENREFPKTEKDLKDIQEKYLQFQYSNHIVSDVKPQEAAQLVSRSYDRVVKKMEKLTEQEVFSRYLNAYARSLDPHTSYFSTEVLEDFEIQMRLELDGIGATLTNDDGFTKVETLVKGGAAERSGLMKNGDKIIEVGQMENGAPSGAMENVIEWELRDVVRLIRGKKGTQVRLKVLRNEKGTNTHHLITLTRDQIKLEDEAAQISYLDKDINGVKRKVGVINLPSFYADSKRGGRASASDVKKLIDEAKTKGVDGLVLDLSYNGGGSLSDAVDLAGLFFKTGNVVKQSSRSEKAQAATLKDLNPEVNWPGPLVVLTSRYSASASEIVSGTLKDYDRAVIVGADHTFGKGSVQQVVPLAPGLGALKVTVGMFFTPSGYSTQHKGVESHIVFPSVTSENDKGEKGLDFSLPPKKIESFISDSAFEGWKKVTPEMITKLSQRSHARIKVSEKFKEVFKDIEDFKKRDKKEIVLEDSLNDRKKNKEEYDKKKNLTKEEKLAEYLKRADIDEAVNVVVDLADLSNNVPFKLAAAPDVSADPNKRQPNTSKKN